MKQKKRKISIQKLIISVFVVSLLVTVVFIGTLIFTRWSSSAEKLALSTSEDISGNIYNEVSALIHTAEHLNEMNHSIIENGILNLSNDPQREQFFVEALKAHPLEVYSFSFGTSSGEYYGARRNEQGLIQIMKNNADTGGNSWYYETNENSTAGKLVVQAGKFDPRTRDWYKVAEQKGKASFSAVYKHFVMNDLTISAAWPIYDQNGSLNGVMGSHLLLSNIGTLLQESIRKYHGSAVIIEKETGLLIANSMSVDNFTVGNDGVVERFGIQDINQPDLIKIHQKYQEDQVQKFTFEGQHEELYVTVKPLSAEGLDWIIVSVLPSRFFMVSVIESMHLTALIAALFLLISLLLYMVITRKIMAPVGVLLKVSDALASGDLTQRVPIVRNDEIGKISDSFNNVASKMEQLVGNLEEAVEERTAELKIANSMIEENNEKLQLILDTAKEAIIGIDTEGKITFLNRSCLDLLGYSDSDEMIGVDMHQKIHYLDKDGSHFDEEDCRIFRSVQSGKGVSVDDEVFWRKDGSYFEVEYHSYPQMKYGAVIGAVITFTDITERKLREREINYLTYHDSLTGLFNRSGFEKKRLEMDNEIKLPLGVIFGDLNGLKLTNDIFGHEAGDQLITKAADILKKSCKSTDIISRVGGDEFVLLLPNTEYNDVSKVVDRIRLRFADEQLDAVKCSMALGFEVKSNVDQPIEEILTNAENDMYKDKTENHKAIDHDMLATIVQSLHKMSPQEKRHSFNVRLMAQAMGVALGIEGSELEQLGKVSYLHDIGKIVLSHDDQFMNGSLDEESEKHRQHAAVGYRILSMFEETMNLADHVYGHHEHWDGRGYPRGIQGERISLFARIISLVEVYERLCFKGGRFHEESRKEAIRKIVKSSGQRFDPNLVKVFLKVEESFKLKSYESDQNMYQ